MKEIKTALSNKVFLDDKGENIIKYYSKDEFKNIFGCQESMVLSKLGYRYELNEERIKIEYFSHNEFDDKAMTNRDMKNVSNALKNLHQISISNMNSTPFNEVYAFLKNRGTKHIISEEQEEQMADTALKILVSGNQVVLHNDVVEGNLLKIDGKIKLIDFEYSGLGNKIFDLASFITEREITQDQINFFINEFDKDTCPIDLKSVSIFLQIFWARWAYYKYEITGKEIYREIGNWKLKQYNFLII